MGIAIVSSAMALVGVIAGVLLTEQLRRRHDVIAAAEARAGRVAAAAGALCEAAVGAMQDLQLAPHLGGHDVAPLNDRLKTVFSPYMTLTVEADVATVRLADAVLEAMQDLAEMIEAETREPTAWEAARKRLGRAGFDLRNQCRESAGLGRLPDPAS